LIGAPDIVQRSVQQEAKMAFQTNFFGPATSTRTPPSTRYQGSKFKLISWLWESVANLRFQTALDAFGGTGSVAYLLKTHGKAVTYNDYLRSNYLIGRALIENDHEKLNDDDVAFALERHSDCRYDDFVRRTFKDIYFTDDENEWIDVVCQNIYQIESTYKQAIAFFALFQSCVVKRPYNLFHRRNLYMRTAEVDRTFGNKRTWDRSFEAHFREFVSEANAAVFDVGVRCRASCFDAVKVEGDFDLVYIDTPYVSKRGVGVDYLDFYHFLEGLADYSHWPSRIDYSRKHLPIKIERSPWADKRQIGSQFRQLFERFRDSILVVSYRSDGVPSESQLVDLLREYKCDVRLIHYGEYKYVLSKDGDSKEILLIGTS